MYVLLDSCIWIKERGLTTNLGTATRFFIRDSAAVLAIPEVVRYEAANQLVTMFLKERDRARRGGGALALAMGQGKFTSNLPADELIRSRVSDLLDPDDAERIAIPISVEASRSAIVCAAEGRVPAGVRDGVIWQGCLGLLDRADVHFVTRDAGYYRDRDRTHLNQMLRDEADQRKHALEVHSGLDKMLESLESAHSDLVLDELDEEFVFEEIMNDQHDWIRELIGEEEGGILGEHFDDAKIESAYPTSGRHRVVLEVRMEWSFDGGDPEDGGRGQGGVTGRFFCLLDRSTDTLKPIELHELDVDGGGGYWFPGSFSGEEGVMRLVRVDDQGRKVRLRPMVRPDYV